MSHPDAEHMNSMPKRHAVALHACIYPERYPDSDFTEFRSMTPSEPVRPNPSLDYIALRNAATSAIADVGRKLDAERAALVRAHLLIADLQVTLVAAHAARKRAQRWLVVAALATAVAAACQFAP